MLCDTGPMDLADATLVGLAEATGECRILSFDRHFRVYRLHGTLPFEVFPA